MQIDLNKHVNFIKKSNYVIDNVIESRDSKQKKEEEKVNSDSRASESTKHGSLGMTDSDEELKSSDHNSQKEKYSSFTQQMHERWHKANQKLPLMDRQDILDECPRFNNGLKSSPEHTAHPEFTQLSYNRILVQEDAY